MQASKTTPKSPTVNILTPTLATPIASLSTAVASAATAKANKATARPNSDPNCEIEEISKKISEHADAIYRTWKCRGLAPTELLDFYTSASAVDSTAMTAQPDFFGNTKAVVSEEVTSTEGLQQLVNTFVIKDKQQRGAKGHNNDSNNKNSMSINKKSAILASKTDVFGDQLSLRKQQKSANIMKLAKPVTQRPSAILLDEATKTATPTATVTSKNKTTPNKKASNVVSATTSKSATRETTTSNNASASIEKSSQTKTRAEQQAVTLGKTKIAASGASGTNKVTNKLDNIASTPNNISLELSVDMDLKNLTQLQTENLLKIKELLQQESVVGEKPKKTLTASSSLTQPVSKAATSTTTITTGHKKRMLIEQSNDNVEGMTNPTTARSTIATTSNRDNAKIVVSSQDVVVADKNSSYKKKATVTPIIAANRSQISDHHQQGDETAAKLSQNQIHVTEKSIKCKENDSTSSNNYKVVSNNSSKILNSTNSPIIVSSKNTQEITVKNTSKLAQTSVSMPETNTTNVSKTATTTSSTDNKVVATPTAAKTSTEAAKTATASAPTVTDSAEAATATCSKTTAATSPPVTENVMEVARSSMPAPTKVKSVRPLTNGQDKNLGRPILTRGSVAERVLMFEKCPEVRHSYLNTKRPEPSDTPPRNLLKVKLHSTPPPPTEQNSLQREIRISGKNVYIPRFYFPHGKPQPQIAIERTLRGILSAFDTFPNNQVTKDELPRILKLCGLPFYWRMPVMIFCQQGNSGLVERQRFVEFWKQMNVYCHDNASRFVYILSRGQRFRSYIVQEDLAPLVQDVVDTHPGLAFLKEATEFHSRYVHTVIARIFYSVNRSWSGKITISELKKSELLEIISLLEEEDDINQIMAFFSYEHFYVIYCKFWELDRDHDLLINQEDLARHSDHALSTRIVERIFSGCVTRNYNKKNPDDESKMSYTDFVWFLLSEEDKRTPTAIEYWFRCMDIDGDGLLSMYELEYFYEEQQQRMESIGIETLPFEDCLCQMLDMIKPQNNDCITLGDLKRCKMTHIFFDTFFNLEKYLDHEQRDPFASQRDEYASDWDRFAAQEYELLITEEND